MRGAGNIHTDTLHYQHSYSIVTGDVCSIVLTPIQHKPNNIKSGKLILHIHLITFADTTIGGGRGSLGGGGGAIFLMLVHRK